MKTIQYSKLFLALVFLTGAVSCVRFERDPSPDTTGTIPTLPENAKVVSVEELEGHFPGNFDSITQSEAGEDYYLLLEVLGNDISGNIYKSMYVRDAFDPKADPEDTYALNLAIDKTNLYNFFPLGQKFYLKCTGLYIGRYNNLPQMGFRYKDDNGAVGLGRIPDEVFMQNVFRYGVAPADEADMPQPIEITDAAQLSSRLYNQLVLLRNVEFAPDEIGQEFAPAPPSGSNPTSSDRIFTINGTGSGLTLRTSSACRFFRRPVPAGKGDMLCIYAIYGETEQFYLRQFSDLNIAQFDSTAPLSRTLFYETFSSSNHNFITYDAEGPAEWTFGTYGGGCMMVQGNGSNKTKNEDWLISPAFTLDGDFDYYDLTFQYVLRYKSNNASDYTIRVLENYEDGMNPYDADWEIIPTSLVQSSDWNFRASNAIDLSDFKGKTIRTAFVYKSDTSYMATWELNNVKVIGHQE